MVLILHADFLSLEKPDAASILNLPTDSALKIFFQTITIIAVNVFVMISGWFGINPSKMGFTNLLFQTVFYLIVVYVIVLLCGVTTLTVQGVKDLILATHGNWFIKAYILLYILAPILNYFVAHSTKQLFRKVLIFFFIFQSIYGWIFPSSTDWFNGGYSTISFIGLYLLARYMNLYRPNFLFKRRSNDYLLIIFIILFVPTICIVPAFMGFNTVLGYNFLTYVSPTVILMAAAIIALFSKIHFKSTIINRLAMSSFAVYLVYVNPNILPLYRKAFAYLYSLNGGILYWIEVIILAIMLYLVVTIFDSIRILIWNKIVYIFSPSSSKFNK